MEKIGLVKSGFFLNLDSVTKYIFGMIISSYIWNQSYQNNLAT